jgi:hypothetical protein
MICSTKKNEAKIRGSVKASDPSSAKFLVKVMERA